VDFVDGCTGFNQFVQLSDESFLAFYSDNFVVDATTARSVDSTRMLVALNVNAVGVSVVDEHDYLPFFVEVCPSLFVSLLYHTDGSLSRVFFILS
jgi:hypothetical protein